MRELNWIAKHTTDFNKEYDLLETILRGSGIEDIEKFLNVSKKNIYDGMLLNNMDKGLELLNDTLKIKERKPRIFIKVDSDVDGFTSASYIYQFIEEIAKHRVELKFNISPDKSHGINYSCDIKGEKYDLIIIPDAASEDVEECEKINKIGIPILILDHHQFNRNEIHNFATVINCTDGTYPNPTLSGVGVVHKFCIEYCKRYNIKEDYANNYLDLVSFGMIADSMDMRNLETRYYALEGLKPENHKNLFLNELFLRNENDTKLGRTITKVGWTFAPKLNAIVRYGTKEEQIDTFRAMCGFKEDIEYQPRRPAGSPKNAPKPPIEIHSLQKTMARICDNAKGRQDADTRKAVQKCNEAILENHLDKNSIIILDATEILPKNTITGLLANKIATIYKRPTLILNQYNETIFGGSGRGYGKGSVSDFRQLLSDTGLFNKCAGHENAFGILLNKTNVQAVIDECNKKIELEDLVKVYEVDYEMTADSLKEENISKIANAYMIWGNKVDEPTFAITNIHIPASQVVGYSKEGSDYVGTINFTYNNIKFSKSYCAKTDFEELTLKDRHTLGKNKKNLKINIIARIVLDEYDGIREPKISIIDFQTEKDSDCSSNNVTTNNTKKASEIAGDFEEQIIIMPKKHTVNKDDFVF